MTDDDALPPPDDVLDPIVGGLVRAAERRLRGQRAVLDAVLIPVMSCIALPGVAIAGVYVAILAPPVWIWVFGGLVAYQVGMVAVLHLNPLRERVRRLTRWLLDRYGRRRLNPPHNQ